MGSRSSFSSAFSDIRLLLWKNFKIQWRHPIQSLFELLLPCLLVFMLTMFRRSVDVKVYQNATVYTDFKLNNLDSQLTRSKLSLMYTPISDQNKAIMVETLANLKLSLPRTTFIAMPFNDSTTMEHYYLTMHNEAKDGLVLCGIKFVELSKNNLNFQLRFTSGNVKITF